MHRDSWWIFISAEHGEKFCISFISASFDGGASLAFMLFVRCTCHFTERGAFKRLTLLVLSLEKPWGSMEMEINK